VAPVGEGSKINYILHARHTHRKWKNGGTAAPPF